MRVTLLGAFVSVSAACASVPGRHLAERTDSSVAGVTVPSRAAPATATTLVPVEPRQFQLEPVSDLATSVNFTTPVANDGIGQSYTALRLGSFDPHGDLSGLDAGFWGEVAFGRKILGVLGVEATVGYFETSGSGGAEVAGIPVLINARLGVPVLILEPYAGVGLGGLWANAKAGGLSSEDSFAAMWDAFIGVEVGLAGLAIGAEYRYVKSDNLDSPGGIGDFQLEGNVFLLTGRLPF